MRKFMRELPIVNLSYNSPFVMLIALILLIAWHLCCSSFLVHMPWILNTKSAYRIHSNYCLWPNMCPPIIIYIESSIDSSNVLAWKWPKLSIFWVILAINIDTNKRSPKMIEYVNNSLSEVNHLPYLAYGNQVTSQSTNIHSLWRIIHTGCREYWSTTTMDSPCTAFILQ